MPRTPALIKAFSEGHTTRSFEEQNVLLAHPTVVSTASRNGASTFGDDVVMNSNMAFSGAQIESSGAWALSQAVNHHLRTPIHSFQGNQLAYTGSRTDMTNSEHFGGLNYPFAASHQLSVRAPVFSNNGFGSLDAPYVATRQPAIGTPVFSHNHYRRPTAPPTSYQLSPAEFQPVYTSSHMNLPRPTADRNTPTTPMMTQRQPNDIVAQRHISKQHLLDPRVARQGAFVDSDSQRLISEQPSLHPIVSNEQAVKHNTTRLSMCPQQSSFEAIATQASTWQYPTHGNLGSFNTQNEEQQRQSYSAFKGPSIEALPLSNNLIDGSNTPHGVPQQVLNGAPAFISKPIETGPLRQQRRAISNSRKERLSENLLASKHASREALPLSSTPPGYLDSPTSIPQQPSMEAVASKNAHSKDCDTPKISMEWPSSNIVPQQPIKEASASRGSQSQDFDASKLSMKELEALILTKVGAFDTGAHTPASQTSVPKEPPTKRRKMKHSPSIVAGKFTSYPDVPALRFGYTTRDATADIIRMESQACPQGYVHASSITDMEAYYAAKKPKDPEIARINDLMRWLNPYVPDDAAQIRSLLQELDDGLKARVAKEAHKKYVAARQSLKSVDNSPEHKASADDTDRTIFTNGGGLLG